MISRKKFLTLAGAGAASAFLLNHSNAQTVPAVPAEPVAPTIPPKRPPKGDPLPAEVVQEFVGASHGKFDRVKELLELHPSLLNASWDWGGGDFESGLEAAGHVGSREIAEYLLARGARMNVFCAAMLGHLDLVKTTLTAYPNLKDSKGPHGLMLKHHALKGGEQAVAVLAYLEEIGAS